VLRLASAADPILLEADRRHLLGGRLLLSAQRHCRLCVAAGGEWDTSFAHAAIPPSPTTLGEAAFPFPVVTCDDPAPQSTPASAWPSTTKIRRVEALKDSKPRSFFRSTMPCFATDLAIARCAPCRSDVPCAKAGRKPNAEHRA